MAADVLMLLNQDQDFLADLSIAICSSLLCSALVPLVSITAISSLNRLTSKFHLSTVK